MDLIRIIFTHGTHGQLGSVHGSPGQPDDPGVGLRLILRRMGRVLEGLAVLAFGIVTTQPDWTWLKTFYLPVVLVCQVICMGSIFMMGSTITFWTVERIEASEYPYIWGERVDELPDEYLSPMVIVHIYLFCSVYFCKFLSNTLFS